MSLFDPVTDVTFRCFRALLLYGDLQRMNQQERGVVQRAQRGDRDAIIWLWNAYTPKLYGYLCNTLRDTDLADDILQRTWIKSIEQIAQFRDRGVTFGAWLFAISRNECRQHWRSSAREIPLDEEIHDTPDPRANRDMNDALMVDAALKTISQDDRELLRLRFIADLPIADIARMFGKSSIAIRVRLHRAIRRARTIIETHNV